MAGVPGDFGDHAYVDEAKAHGADNVVFDQILQLVFRGDFARSSTCRGVFGDHVGEGFVVDDAKASVSAGSVPVALIGAHARQGSLEPEASAGSAILDQRNGL